MKSSYSMSRQIVSDCLKLAFSNTFILNIEIKGSRKLTKHQHSFIVNITKLSGIKLNSSNLFAKIFIQTKTHPRDNFQGLILA